MVYSLQKSNRQVDGGFNFDYRAAHFDCHEGFSGGYDSCEMEVSLEAQSFANSPDNRRANLVFECDAEVTTEDSSGIFGYETVSDVMTLSLRAGRSQSDNLSLQFDFFTAAPIVKASIESLHCELRSID